MPVDWPIAHSDPDVCATCGNQFPADQQCDACRRKAAGDDPELRAMAVVVAELEPLDGDAQRRVVTYLMRRYGCYR